MKTRKRHAGRSAALSLLLVVAMLAPIASVPTEALAASPAATDVLADFEGLTAPPEFFAFFGGSSVRPPPITVADGDPLARPTSPATTTSFRSTTTWSTSAGFGEAFQAGGAQDWSGYASFDFWFYGTGSGLAYQAEISDNRSDPDIDTSERFDYDVHRRLRRLAADQHPFAGLHPGHRFPAGRRP